MTVGPCHVRPATRADALAVWVAERAIAATPGRLVSRPDELRPDAFAATIARLHACPRAGHYVVAVGPNEQLRGHAFLEAMPLANLAHVFRLTIAVHPGGDGQGIGRALMTHLCNWARGNPHLEKVELAVRSTNHRAIALYRAFGFIDEGRLRGRLKLPSGQYVDDLLMAWWPRQSPPHGR